jgi:tol-pal system protein YbgF
MAPTEASLGRLLPGAAAARRRSRARAATWAAVPLLSLALLAGPATAGLFDDDEARKAILDLRARIAQSDEQSKARSAELAAANAQLLEQINALRRSLLDLNNQLELLRGDVAKLRGSDEQLQRELSDLQKRQKDLGQAYDDRLRKLEPVKVTLDGREFAAEPDERKAYDDAVALMRGGDFDKASTSLAAFQRRFPNSGYGDSVRYWLGNAQYARRDYKSAIETFRAFVTAAPEHARAPEALLAMANSQAEMKDTKSARKTLDDLVKAYPKSEAAQAGKERLASLK